MGSRICGPRLPIDRGIRREEVALSVRVCQVAVAASIMHVCGTFAAAAMTTGRGGARPPRWNEGFNQNLMNYA